jgi:hypothetical protein
MSKINLEEDLDPDELELVKNIVILLIAHGMPTVSMGSLLRVLGHDPVACEAYDDEIYRLAVDSQDDDGEESGPTIH